MNIKYKLKNKKLGTSHTDIKEYHVDEKGCVSSVVISKGEIVITEDHEFYRFMEQIDGIDIYDKDKAIAEVFTYGRDDDGEMIYVGKTLIGQFRELFEEGLFYFCTDDEYMSYIASETKIVRLIE